MSKTKNQTTRQQTDALRSARAAWRAERAEAIALRDRAAVDSLARYGPRTHRTPSPHVAPGDEAPLVFRRAPRLHVVPYATAVRRVLRATPFRDDWSPRGKGRDMQFRSLAEHHLARFAMPPVLWTAFFDPFVERLVPLVVHVARGGSLHDHVRETDFPVPLTRRMCHDLLSRPFRGSLLYAMRTVQALAVGADGGLLHGWRRSPFAQRLGTREEEIFWFEALGWMAKWHELDSASVGPLLDFIAHRRGLEPSFSMAGRSLAAVRRAMDEWHRDLARAEELHGTRYDASGFEPLVLDLSRRSLDGTTQKVVWRVQEIRTGRELAAEGRRMSHCVYSYAARVQSGATSIWSMTLENGLGETGCWAMLTIEVRNAERRVVQARGRFNRQPTSAEHAVLVRWAGENDLTLAV